MRGQDEAVTRFVSVMGLDLCFRRRRPLSLSGVSWLAGHRLHVMSTSEMLSGMPLLYVVVVVVMMMITCVLFILFI